MMNPCCFSERLMIFSACFIRQDPQRPLAMRTHLWTCSRTLLSKIIFSADVSSGVVRGGAGGALPVPVCKGGRWTNGVCGCTVKSFMVETLRAFCTWSETCKRASSAWKAPIDLLCLFRARDLALFFGGGRVVSRCLVVAETPTTSHQGRNSQDTGVRPIAFSQTDFYANKLISGSRAIDCRRYRRCHILDRLRHHNQHRNIAPCPRQFYPNIYCRYRMCLIHSFSTFKAVSL